jgi:hypothetical protein
VSSAQSTASPTVAGAAVGTAQLLAKLSKPPTTGTVTVLSGVQDAIPAGTPYAQPIPSGGGLDPYYLLTITGLTIGAVYTLTIGNAGELYYLSGFTPAGVMTVGGSFTAMAATYYLIGPQTNSPAGPYPTLVVTATLRTALTLFTLAATDTVSVPRQRVRLTAIPQLATTLRVLGKTTCPALGDYDEMPINSVESALIAFGRGDMLLRQRQHGKAQLAQQEGAMLLAQLARSEVFQQASSHRIVPDGGFGGDNYISQPNSLNPL